MTLGNRPTDLLDFEFSTLIFALTRMLALGKFLRRSRDLRVLDGGLCQGIRFQLLLVSLSLTLSLSSPYFPFTATP